VDDIDLDSLLAVISNPTRRQILRKLVKETHYPLQLSRELRVSQQAIMKHLTVLEEHDLVKSGFQKSDKGGPPRKYYEATKSLTIVIDLGPELFSEELRFHVKEPVIEGAADAKSLKEAENLRVKLGELTRQIASIDRKLDELAGERDALIDEKESAMHYANRLVDLLCDSYAERKVLRYLVAERDFSIQEAARRLDMRESEVEEILRKLEAEGLLMLSI
jgi:ArsR family transcriptional regulator